MNALDQARLALPAASPGPAARRRWTGRLRWPALILALCGAGLGINWWLLVGRWLEATDNAYIQGDIAVLEAWMVVVAVFVIAFNLLADVLYSILDPRIRLS